MNDIDFSIEISGFSYDLILVEVSERDDIVWFIFFSVCKRFGS